MRKILPILFVFGIATMMMMAILPANANHPDNGTGVCPGPWSHISVEDAIEVDPNAASKDRNGNGNVCIKFSPNGVGMVKDDRIPRN